MSHTLGTNPSKAVQGWAWTTIAAATLTSLLPIFDDSEPIVTGGVGAVMLLLVILVPLAWGAIDATDQLRRGVIVGSSLFAGGFFLLVTATVVLLKRSLGEFIQLGPGIAPLIATVGAGWMTALIGLRDDGDPAQARLGVGARWTGVAAGSAIALGIMLPPPDSALSMKDLNFSFDDGFLQFAWLVFLAVAGGAAVVGFRSGRRWGLGVVVGGTLPVIWIVINALFEIERPAGQEVGFGGVLRREVHPLLVIAVITAAIVVVVGTNALSLSTSTTSSQSSPPAESLPAPGAAMDNLQGGSEMPPTALRDVEAPHAGEETDEQPTSATTAGAAEAPDDAATGTFGLRSMDQVSSRGGAADSPVDDRTITATGMPFGPVLQFSDGRRHVVLGTLIIGREPTSIEADEYPILVETGEHDRQISKTHLAIGLSADGHLWAEDRHSTNGVLVSPAERTAFKLDPGRRTSIDEGTTLLIGEISIFVEAGVRA